MPKKINEIGNIYGKLTVIEETNKRNSSGDIFWKCQCECGKIVEVRGSSLRKGITVSCGCNKLQQSINEIGNTYGKLTVIGRAKNRGKRAYWICQCECGKIVEVSGYNLRKENGTRSCGCWQIKNKTNERFGKLIVLEQLPDNQWRCQCDCGNIIIASGRELERGHKNSCGCLNSKGEQKIIEILNKTNIKFEKEKTFLSCKNLETNKNFRFDFYLPDYNCIIEYDGEQHFIGWGKDKENLKQIQQKDQLKTNWCKENNIKLIRIPYFDYVNLNEEYLINKILPEKQEK